MTQVPTSATCSLIAPLTQRSHGSPLSGIVGCLAHTWFGTPASFAHSFRHLPVSPHTHEETASANSLAPFDQRSMQHERQLDASTHARFASAAPSGMSSVASLDSHVTSSACAG